MNSLIDSLNLWGERWLSFAWPMLWQSSLLIALLFAFDLACRRRVRAALRYALWLVVLVKLVLPPSLALPTGVAWWLPSAKPTPAPKPQPNFVVTYGNAPVRRTSPVVVTPYTPPPPTLAAEGWALLAWASVGLGLLGWMGVRWWQVARDVRRASPGEAWQEELLAMAQGEAGLRGRVRLRLTERPMSPAVCGLIRPVILLPRGLVEQLPPAQLRAVLLHELVHLWRGDVWVNCLQALLQIGYWWHPLVWLANARIRRVREEAVDDAVMLALRDEADHYAPTLLEVAKLAFRRPLASLGLVGILESRSALRQRIERLVNFQPPRRAGISVVAGLGIAAFAAVAVPMGQGPARAETNRANVNDVPAAPQTGATINGGVAEAQWLDLVEQLLGEYPDLPIAALTAHSTSALPDPGQLRLPALMPAHSELGIDLGIDAPSQPNPLLFDPLPDTSVRDFNRVGPQVHTDAPLSTRVFRFDGEAFEANVRQRAGLSEAADMAQFSKALRKVFAQLGVDLQPPKSIFYNGAKQKVQRLLVHATPAELDTIGVFIAGLQTSPTWSPASNLVPAVSAAPLGDAEGTGVQAVHALKSPAQEAASLVKDGKLLLELGKLDEAEAKLKHAMKLSSGNSAAAFYLLMVLDARNRRDAPTHAAVAGVRTNLVPTGKGRQAIIRKLYRISFAETQPYNDLPLSEVVRSLNEESKRGDPDQRGVLFIVGPTVNTIPQPAQSPTVESNTGPLVQPSPSIKGVDAPSISVRLPALKGVTLADLLEAVVKAAERPISYSIEEDAVVFSLRGQEIQPLTTRVFKVDPNTLLRNLQGRGYLSANEAREVGQGKSASAVGQTRGAPFLDETNAYPATVQRAIRSFLAAAGAELEPPKAMFYNDRTGKLIVRAAASDLDFIQALIEELNYTPPQVNIQAKFIEMSEEAYREFYTKLSPTNVSAATNWTAILSADQMRDVVKDLEQREGTDLLMTPEVTTLSERQAQVHAVDIRTILTGINPQALTSPGVESAEGTNGLYQIQSMPCGPVLDIHPAVTADGYRIEVVAIPTVTESLGYDEGGGEVTVYVKGKKDLAKRPLPRFRARQAFARATVWDGETLLIGGISPVEIFKKPDGEMATEPGRETGRRLVVLVTPTIIDPAGNRVHPAGENPFAREGVPAQLPR